MQLPIGSEGSFKGVVDLLTEQAIIWEDDLGKEPRETDIPEDLLAEVAKARALLIEHIAETDDALTLKYLEGDAMSVDELKAALRRAVIDLHATPVFCGSSLRNKGVQLMLDAVIDYLPAPSDIPPVKGTDLRKGTEIERAG